MKYAAGFLIGLFLGCQIHNQVNVYNPPVDSAIERPSRPLPKEVQEQFDSYLLTTPILESIVIKIVKKVLQIVLVGTVISLVIDYPIQAIFLIVSIVSIAAYPMTRNLINKHLSKA